MPIAPAKIQIGAVLVPTAILVSQDDRLRDEIQDRLRDQLDGELTLRRELPSDLSALAEPNAQPLILDLDAVDPGACVDLLAGIAEERLRVWPLIVVAGQGDRIPLELAGPLDASGAAVLIRTGAGRAVLSQLLAAATATRPGPPPETHLLQGKSLRMFTRDAALGVVLDEVRLAAAYDVTLLLVGETGSGKTTLAQLVHELSPRASEKFMHLACGALPPSLIESELFGHVRGSFTGADRDKIGKFEAAGQGTLLLDEIDTLSLDQQAKLLRVIETGEFEPIGSNETRKMKARLIVASNVCLEKLAAADKFRKDLYYRLNVMRFQLPPLRERQNDIVPLSISFIQDVIKRCNVPIRNVQPAFLAAMKNYQWPGNIRELKNCIERAVILCRRDPLSIDSLPPAVLAEPGERTLPRLSSPAPLNDKISLSEQAIIEEALRRNKYKRSAVARELGISRVTLYNKMRKYGLH